jgi:hypothetical protein
MSCVAGILLIFSKNFEQGRPMEGPPAAKPKAQ